ncbi:nuclear transport factor 2 family protein [Streptomyces sp. NRAIS4]
MVDAYAHCADRRDAKGQMALFTEDTHFLVFMDATAAEPTQELHGRDSLAPVFDNLNSYQATTHFNCLAHHISRDEPPQRTIMIAAIRYLDQFVKRDGNWYFAERRLMIDWTETRPCSP